MKNIFIVLILFTKLVAAHNGSIEGYVYDNTTNMFLEGASVTIAHNSMETTTDVFGKYFFNGLPEGNYTITITYLGYTAANLAVSVNENITSKVETPLTASAISLVDVIVSPSTNPSSNTIQALDLKLRPTESAQDALRLVPGLFIAQHAGGGKAEQIFLRGFDIDHGTDISVNADGIPVNMVSHAHGQGYADLHFLIPETVASIDFQKGPYNVHYGDFTTAGFVNFNTYDAIDKSSLKVSGGSFNTFRTVAMLNLLSDQKNSAYITGEYFVNDGPFDSPQDFQRISLFGKYNARINETSLLSFSLSTFKSQWNASGQIPLRALESGMIDRFGAIDDGEGGFTGRTNANFELTKILDNSTTVKNQFYYSRYNFELYSNFTFFLEDSINGDEIKQKEQRNIFGYKGSFVRDKYFTAGTLTHDYGMGFRYDQVMNNELSHTVERNTTLNTLALGNVFQNNMYAYASETFSFHNDFTINAALRFDYFNFAYDDQLDSLYEFQSIDDHIPSFKLNFDYQVNDNTLIYLYSGTGFHSNDTRVAVAQNGLETLPMVYGVDLGVQLKPFEKLLLNPALWVLYLEQEFVYVGDGAVVEPSGKTLRKGVDLTARLEITKWLFLDADINFTQAEALSEAEGENYIPLAPDFTSIGGLTVKTQKGFSGSFRYRYIDDRPANETGSVIAEGYFINDVLMNYATNKYEVGLEIQNLFNVEWNEAQFDTESRLPGEAEPVSELHFTPGVPFYAKASLSYFF
ncbi:MAG: TonB-dependent receptor [Chitinophagales bacterium]